MLDTLLDNKAFLAVASAVLGGVVTILTQRILGKRGLFTYSVSHSRVGISAEDAVFGSVKVTWNEKPVANLYSSTVELRNESFKDYSDVAVRVFSTDTYLLTERTEIAGTTHSLLWTKEFAQKLMVPAGQQAAQWQHDLYDGRRDYLVPTMNRGQVVRLTFLNVAKGQGSPTIWVDILHQGVRLKFRVAPLQFMGVPQPSAVLAGAVLGAIALYAVISYISTLWVAALLSMVYGLVVPIPGALVVRFWRWLRDSIGS